MSKLLAVLAVCSLVLCLNVLSTATPLAFSLLRGRTTTTTTTLAPPTTESSVSIWLENNIPKIAEGCTAHYVCKKKIKHGPGTARVCVKYCLKKVECPAGVAGVPASISPDWCVLLNQDALDEPVPVTSNVTATMQVNMIDFPCQPGYLPDSRGRCREVW